MPMKCQTKIINLKDFFLCVFQVENKVTNINKISCTQILELLIINSIYDFCSFIFSWPQHF
jgi:hypothetical protein